jgi:hypothetical protein
MTKTRLVIVSLFFVCVSMIYAQGASGRVVQSKNSLQASSKSQQNSGIQATSSTSESFRVLDRIQLQLNPDPLDEFAQFPYMWIIDGPGGGGTFGPEGISSNASPSGIFSVTTPIDPGGRVIEIIPLQPGNYSIVVFTAFPNPGSDGPQLHYNYYFTLDVQARSELVSSVLIDGNPTSGTINVGDTGLAQITIENLGPNAALNGEIQISIEDRTNSGGVIRRSTASCDYFRAFNATGVEIIPLPLFGPTLRIVGRRTYYTFSRLDVGWKYQCQQLFFPDSTISSRTIYLNTNSLTSGSVSVDNSFQVISP